MFKGKKGNIFWIVVAVIFLLWLTTTQKVIVNDKQYSSATPSSCALISKDYDPLNKICVKRTQNNITSQNGTI